MQEECVPEKLVPALREILATQRRTGQLEAFSRLDGIMSTGAVSPSERARHRPWKIKN